MKNKLEKFRSWFSGYFQLITVGLLVSAVLLIIKQQYDLKVLQSKINDVEHKIINVNDHIDFIDGKIDYIEIKLDDVESNLSSEIEDITTVRIYSDYGY